MDRKWIYTWLGGSVRPIRGVIEPIHRVPGSWEEAWRERMRRWDSEPFDQRAWWDRLWAKK